jgi:hypothetical protein
LVLYCPPETEERFMSWKAVIAHAPGTRFRARYRERADRRSGPWRKWLLIGLGVVLILIGALMLVLPGPGILAVLVGAGMIAGDSLIAARALDRIEGWIARRVQRRRQRRSPTADR